MAYLERDDAKWLEQEEQDPTIPQIGYAQSMGVFDKTGLKNLGTPWKPDMLSLLGGPKTLTWKPELKCGVSINCPPYQWDDE